MHEAMRVKHKCSGDLGHARSMECLLKKAKKEYMCVSSGRAMWAGVTKPVGVNATTHIRTAAMEH